MEHNLIHKIKHDDPNIGHRPPGKPIVCQKVARHSGTQDLRATEGDQFRTHPLYPLVNVYVTMERSTILYRSIHYFDWAIFQFAIYVCLPGRGTALETHPELLDLRP